MSGLYDMIINLNGAYERERMANIMAEKKYENIMKDIMRCIEEQVEL